MKKTLIALAAVAMTSAAFAQSSVTLYGRVDASLGATKNTVTGVSTTSLFNGGDAGLTGSRWGMQGTEDLGGGLKAVFRLEQRYSVDTGALGGVLFNGESRVGLTGGFGEVHLGRTYSAFDSVKAVSVSKSVFDSSFTPTGGMGSPNVVFNSYDVRVANGIRYNSPKMGGFSASASLGLKENDVAPAGLTAKNHTSLAAFYSAGPISAAVGVHKRTADDSTMFSGAYNLGVVALSGGYGMTKQVAAAGSESTGYVLGAEMPMGPIALSVGYSAGEVKSKTTGAKTSEFSGIGFGVTYAMSKRTKLYAGYKDVETKNAANVKTAGQRLYAAGVRHDF